MLKRPDSLLSQIDHVHRQLKEVFDRHSVDVLVCAGACGADLVALDVARSLGIRRRIVLPTDRQAFREESVVDRPGSWGSLFDEIAAAAAESGDLVELTLGSGQQAFLSGNNAILDEAESLARERDVELLAIVIWGRCTSR